MNFDYQVKKIKLSLCTFQRVYRFPVWCNMNGVQIGLNQNLKDMGLVYVGQGQRRIQNSIRYLC